MVEDNPEPRTNAGERQRLRHVDPSSPENPFGIDVASEARKKKTFFILIGAGFVLVIVMLVVAFLLDRELGTPVDPSGHPASTPGGPSDAAALPYEPPEPLGHP